MSGISRGRAMGNTRRTSSGQVATCVSALCLLLLLAIFLGGTSAAAQESQLQSPPRPTPVEMEEGLNASNSAIYEAELTDPEAAEELPHQELDREQALNLMQAVFDPLLQQPAGVFDELEVERFLSDNAAIVAPGDLPESSGPTIGAPPQDRYEGAVLLESTTPLRTDDGSGPSEVVDLGLEHSDGEVQPSNPLVEVGIPQQLGEGIQLPEAGVTVKLDDAPEDRSPTTIDQSVAAYPEVSQDTSLAVAPAPGGFETMTLLQSADAPTSQTFDLELPAGATLQPTQDGGAEVTREGQPLLGIASPTAIDAAGEEVPAGLAVSGNALTLEVSPKPSTSWPVMLDPLYETYNWWNGITGLGGWKSYTNASPNYYNADHATCTTYASPYACQSGVTSNAPGLYIGALPGAVPIYSTADWEFPVPRLQEEWTNYGRYPESFIASMTLEHVGFWHRTDSAPSPTLWMGIWKPSSPGWVSGYARGGDTPDINANGVFDFGSGQNTEGKIATFNVSNADGHNLSAFRDAFVNTAIVSIADTGAPNLSPAIGPNQWVNQVPIEPITVTARDLGLGVYRLKVAAENVPQSSGWPVQTMPCTGTTIYPCKGASTFTLIRHGEGDQEVRDYNPAVMPQGVDNVLLTAEDPLGNKSETNAVKVWVDHTAPNLSLSGSMTEQAKLGTNLPQYTLKYSATDGDGAAASALSQFSSAGTGEGKLERPLGAAVDKEGDVWVVDRTNRRVEEFSESGQFLRQFGSAGSGNGQFMDPCGIAISSNGNIVVSDMTNNNVQAFTPTGQFIRTITYSGFADPYAIAPAPGGALWVGDNSAHHVFELSETGTLLKTLGEPSHNGGPLNVPSGLATDAAGNLWVSDTAENRILKYSPSGEFIMQFGTAGTGNGQFMNPTSIAVASSGNLMVSDATNNRLEEFQSNGAYLRQFGSLGTGPGQVTEERGLAFGPGNVLYVADAGNHRIDRWSHADLDRQSGVVSTEVKVDGQLVEPKYAPGCTTENCSVNNREWTFNANAYGSGQHKVQVIATDGVGLQTTKEVTITSDGTPPELTTSGAFFEAPEGWMEQKGYFASTVAKDPGGSGVVSSTFKIDGATLKKGTQSCPGGGCQLPMSGTIPMGLFKGGAHAAELIATDGAGNTAKKVWTINVDPKGTVSGAEAVDTLEASDETAESTVVAPTDEVVNQEEKMDGNDPGLEQKDQTFIATGVPTETELPTDPSAVITVPTLEGSIQIDPLGTAGGSPITVANEAAIVVPNTGPSVDTINRPVYDGFMAFADIRTSEAPETYSWRVLMGKGQSLTQIDEQTAEVVYGENGTIAATIHAEPAHDATGKELSTSLTVDSPDVVTLTVHHRVEGVVYPVVGGPGFQVGYEFVQAYIPTIEEEKEGVPGEIEEVEVSAPEPATASEAEVEDLAKWRGKIEHRHFQWVSCITIMEIPDVHLRSYNRCGNPFTGDEGENNVAFNYGLKGDYYIVPGEWAKHRGGPTDHISCDKMYDGDHINQGQVHADYFIDPATQCKWWGHTQYSEQSFAPYGHHLTPYGEWHWGVGSPGNWSHHDAGLALYIWASKDHYVGHHKTTCIDC